MNIFQHFTELESFSDWNSLKRNEEVKAIPWCNEKLDYIIEKEQIEMNIKKGTFLDLATGWNTSSSHFLKETMI
jgi:hypothetical protein